MTEEYTMTTPEPVKRITRDIAAAGRLLTRDEARFLVDAYYVMQDDRKRANNQVRALDESKEPNEILEWFAAQSATLENSIKNALDKFSASSELGKWARSQVGIGPVIAAGLLAHIDIERVQTAGQVWRFAGLDPTQKWEKGQKRPWNARLKVLCWKIGESFVKVSGNEDAFYAQLYVKRKEFETVRNDRGDNAARAAEILTEKKIGKTTEAYKHLSGGKLPPAQIHARAKRYAVKLFLAHYFETGYRLHHKVEPPLPYAIAHLNHAHRIDPN